MQRVVQTAEMKQGDSHQQKYVPQKSKSLAGITVYLLNGNQWKHFTFQWVTFPQLRPFHLLYHKTSLILRTSGPVPALFPQ